MAGALIMVVVLVVVLPALVLTAGAAIAAMFGRAFSGGPAAEEGQSPQRD